VAVSSGTYIIQVTQVSAGGAKKIYTASVTVLQLSDQVFYSLVASANPVPPGVNQVQIKLLGAGAGTVATGGVYSLAGELSGRLSGGTTLSWNIPAGLSSGVYLLRVEATNQLGHRKCAILKISLLR